MIVASWVATRLCKLPQPRRAATDVERDVEIKMPDGANLLADRWYPVGDGGPLPTILIRSPYGRRPFGLIGQLYAERGYITLIQSTRGTFGSDGETEPFRTEQADGLATLEWVAGQPWFGGKTATWGPSYLGIVQWAIAAKVPDHVKAMGMHVTASNVRNIVYPGGTFSLETGAVWMDLVHHQELPRSQHIKALLQSQKRLRPVFKKLPLRYSDEVGLGQPVPFYKDWVTHETPGDQWWAPVDFSADADKVPPVSMVTGWYDLFLPHQLDDFQRIQEAGRTARITIGPWHHQSPGNFAEQIRDGLSWFDKYLLDRESSEPDRAPVRLWVMGSERWADLEQWPPPAEVERWHLHQRGFLSPSSHQDETSLGGRGPSTAAGALDRYRNDPADPAPGIGGPSLNALNCGPKDQARREARHDVLTYTSDVLADDMVVAGPLSAEVWVRNSTPHFDVSVRLCEVDQQGRSWNISDGIQRVNLAPGGAGGIAITAGADGTARVRVDMWPTAITFRRGRRIRLQIASCAHPLFARNLGGPERLADGVQIHRSDVEVFHDADHPSGIDLPVSSI